MSAEFVHDDLDIVTLTHSRDLVTARHGWVNVGEHSVYIDYNPVNGDLKLAIHPRANEGTEVAELHVRGFVTRQMGGHEPRDSE